MDYKTLAKPHLDAARAAVAAHQAQHGSWQVSDIIDDEFQYVDLVMEGGGVLGIALAGYVYVLEELGIRFLQLGGTSAGSINALLMAAAGRVEEAKTDRILQVLDAQHLADFVDGDADARDFVQVLVENGKLLKYFWKGAQVVDNFTQDFGLHPGTVFHDWLRQVLARWDVHTLRDLYAQKRTLTPGRLRLRSGATYAPGHPIRVALIAADVTTESKVVFPEMADLYYADPLAVNPADFVRASMSIPLFFHPYKVTGLPDRGEATRQRWRQAAGYEGPVPGEAYFIDGGIMSNFPVDLFHQHYQVPACPTFGIKLGQDRSQPKRIGKFTQLLGAIFDAARHVHDYDFITRNPDFRHLVVCAETDQYNWLDFHLPPATKGALFAEGARAAAKFVRGFDWAGYKDVRRELLKAYQVTDAVKPSDTIT